MITIGIRAKKTYQVAGVGQDTTKELAEQADFNARVAREGTKGGSQSTAPKGPDSPVVPGVDGSGE